LAEQEPESSASSSDPGHIAGQEDFRDITEAAVVVTEPLCGGDSTVDSVARRRSTLSLAEQEPESSASSSDPGHIADATIAQALDTLLTLARDPEIRRRMREMLE
jgi:hypothetical protein